MNSQLIRLTIVLVSLHCIFSCKTSKKIYVEKNPVFITANSSCRSSILKSIIDESTLKEAAAKNGEENLSNLKIKQGKTPENSTYRFKETELLFIEKCGTKDSPLSRSLSLSYIISIEKPITGEVIRFRTDTNLVRHQSIINESNNKQIDPLTLIPILSKKSYSKLNSYLRPNK